MMELIVSFGSCILLEHCTGIESSATVRASKSARRGGLVPVSVGGQTLTRVLRMNWPSKKVLGNFTVISLALPTPLASSAVAPAIPLILKELQVDGPIWVFVISIYVMGYVTRRAICSRCRPSGESGRIHSPEVV